MMPLSVTKDATVRGSLPSLPTGCQGGLCQMSRYELFDRSRIRLESFQKRGHDLVPEGVLPLERPKVAYAHPEFPELTSAIVAARQADRPVVLMMGAHPIKAGLSRYLVDLIERGWVTHVASNGASTVHDFELALGEGTSEDVAKWIRRGQFGLWREPGRLNAIVLEAARRGEGLGEGLGRTIEEARLPRADLSLFAAGWRCHVPVTVHVGIGNDIIHAHADCDGAAWGAASYTDFLIFARTLERLEGGVFLNVGSAVTGPEVFLKALSMARNVAAQQGRSLHRFTTAVFDLVELPDTFRAGPPGKDHPAYYYRPWKTLLVRTVADGGRSYYFRGDHRRTLPTLWWNLAEYQSRVVSAAGQA